METDFPSFLSSSCVCGAGEQRVDQMRGGSWVGWSLCVCQLPAPGWTLMATLACPQLRPARLCVYSYPSPGHNLR